MVEAFKSYFHTAIVVVLTGALLVPPASSQTLAGTKPLEMTGDITLQMVHGVDRFLSREVEASVERRKSHWHQNFSSPKAYEESVAANREHFRRIIGLVDERVAFKELTLDATTERSSLVAKGPGYEVHTVRWPVLEGVEAEGLLLQPDRTPVANVVALPDADWTPEVLAGLQPGLSPASQFARRLAENGCRVVVPVLIDRRDTWAGNVWPGNPRLHLTNEPHRELIYRMSYQMGRHIIGYEVQKVLAAVDWFERKSPGRPVGVFGYGEGGLLALYSAAADTRIGATAVSGYFESRQHLYEEPFYRNVWSLLYEFGDAELAGLVAPRRLVVEASRGPEVTGPKASREPRYNTAAPGRLRSPAPESVQGEVQRARPVFEKLGLRDRLSLVMDPQGEPGSEAALKAFLRGLGVAGEPAPPGPPLQDRRAGFDSDERQRRQFLQLVDFTQRLLRRAEYVRQKFWEKTDNSSIEKWEQSTEWYRQYYWEEIIGKFPPASEPLQARTRVIYNEPKWTGYEVMLPVWPDVFAYGILLVPKDLKPGERRPVVVCQHGVNKRVQLVVDPAVRNHYKNFAARLADQGFIVYAPQGPHFGEPDFLFRQFQRKANPIKRSIFSIILAQHERLLDWLAELPFVDPARIGLYGLSYGGLTAVRVPPLLKRYSLAISSGDFIDWVWKTAGWDHHYAFLFRAEHDHFDFNIANTFNHADAAKLMAPRAFMVERGHSDLDVGPDEWVAHEYAKVALHYATLGIPQRTRIEYFNGVHEINAQGTFEFLHEQLKWPRPSEYARGPATR
jgi:dienelactone hydrolase